ncbi:hypothetical protein [Parabacteroides johnsonii]|uniref:hypothetical protein n=2 Tax=Parabacteroides johnsonii TaxID=387661 RepID=UPI00242A7C57|nr:hypothetical protein [Parabacteroides johnsonii]
MSVIPKSSAVGRTVVRRLVNDRPPASERPFARKKTVGFTQEVCEQRTMEYLKTHPYITGKVYRGLCRCGKTKAAADLKKMMQEGKLVRTFVGNAYLFRVPMDGRKEKRKIKEK